MLVATLCGAASGYSAPARPALHSARASRGACMMSADPDKVLRRAEFWEPQTCTLLELINVLGRWESSTEWATRTEFAVVDKARDENMAQGASVKRFEYAQRNSLGERVALNLNAPKLQFKDEKLAASVGKTVEEMNAMPVSKIASDVLYDALAQSKSSLIPQKVLDQRRASLIGPDGGLNEGAYYAGMIKSRIAVITGFFLLGKGQLYGYILGGKLVLDATGTYDLIRGVLGEYTDPIALVLTIGAVYLTYQQSAEVQRRTGDFETYTMEEALEREKYADTSVTIFDKIGFSDNPAKK